MKIIVQLILFIITAILPLSLNAASNDRADWMNEDINSLMAQSPGPDCIEMNSNPSLVTTNKSVDFGFDRIGEWVSTGQRAAQDKMLQIRWSASIIPVPKKYRVLYRIDPRFNRPTVFIQTYDTDTKQYKSDFHAYKAGALLGHQQVTSLNSSILNVMRQDYLDYFNFQGRNKIKVESGDVVSIKLDRNKNFFAGDSELTVNLGQSNNKDKDFFVAYTESPLSDNKIIYANDNIICNYIGGSYCAALYPSSGLSTLTGIENNPEFRAKKDPIPVCSDNAKGRTFSPLCHYDKGRGMELSIDSTIIKPTLTPFMHSNFTNEDVFYYNSNVAGDLDFKTSWDMDIYGNNAQFMANWDYNSLFWTSIYTQYPNLTPIDIEPEINFLHIGRYLMEVEVANGQQNLSAQEVNDIDLEYIIVPDGGNVPDINSSGTPVSQVFKGNADKDGYIWLRVVNRNNNSYGQVDANIAAYLGSTWASNLVYNNMISPLRDKFHTLTETLYRKLTTDPVLQRIAKILMTLYISIYALLFLMGAVNITALDVITRVAKIAIIVALFSETSWTFFNEYLFDIFIVGTDQLMSSVTGTTGQAGNVFGYLDPIFDTYTSETFWQLWTVLFLQFWNGMTLVALLFLYSIFLFMSAVIEVIVSYCLAFLSLAVLISLAPFFFLFILFKYTEGWFYSWLSVLLQYMLRPTILLIFFLLVNQIMDQQLAYALPKSCWGILIPFSITINLEPLFTFKFALPFLPGIPYYVPEYYEMNDISDFASYQHNSIIFVIATCLLFYAFAKLSKGLIEYTGSLVETLTQTLMLNADQTQSTSQELMQPVKDIGHYVKSKGREGFVKAVDMNEGRRESKRARKIEEKNTVR